jgi:very-short-patch-repair endonuclease
LLDLVQEAQLPVPETEQWILDYRVDLLWRDLRLIVEVDGYASHGTRAAFGRDRRQDARLQAAGFVVIRFTAVQIEPLAVLARLAQSILAQTRALASSFPEFDVGARS